MSALDAGGVRKLRGVGAARLARLLAGACALALVWSAAPAAAGGTQVAVVAVAGDVWLTTGFDVVKLDAFTGRVVRRNATRYQFPLELGVSDGNVWVTSVENGFVSGAVTRIPFESGRVTQPLVFPSRPVLSLAVGSGTTWALVGPWASLGLAAIDQATGRATLTRLRQRVGWIAADNVGDTPGLFGVNDRGQAIRLTGTGGSVWTATTDRIESPAAVGLGKVWVASRTGLYRLDAATGRVEAKVPVLGHGAELTLGGGFLWAVSLRSGKAGESYELFKVDPGTARVVKHANLAGPVGAISFGSDALWMGRASPTVGLVRIDPRTLTERLFAKNLG